ncbi:NAD(P)H-dependent oxidoreductase [Actinoplanes couchii]|uniref:Flavodoxin family protein n=1 Tax=Actinoplanes couchii TaxID=403638 RepID=A0ABQ3XM88_9ACTN|nr:flavodoxin family protein [Actinoplanes couchii]
MYAHPSPSSFTREVLDAFVSGLPSYTVSDLYASGFSPVMTAAEYAGAVPPDVRAEQELLDAADTWAFVYPVWWADCPAILKGWFDRVLTVGWAYKPMRLNVATRALVLCTAGHPTETLESSGVLPAMRTVMLTDRIGPRAHTASFHVLAGPDKATHLETAAALGRSLATRPG